MLRKILFWSHLVCGLAAGALILVMSFTGAALAFEKDLLAWAERDARRLTVPATGSRLTVDELLARARVAQPDVRIGSLTVARDPGEAATFTAPGNRTFCVNPYTGEVREALAPRTRAFMQAMRAWHTRLNVTPPPAPPPGQPRPANPGAFANAAANCIFVFLCLSGLVLWWPRAWTWRALRPLLVFTPEARGRARDWNWHNAIGFWSLPLLLVLAGTGVVLSYRWAGDLVYRLAGETPPPPQIGPPPPPALPPAARATVAAAPVGLPLTAQGRLDAVKRATTGWTHITLRFAPALGASASDQPAPKTFSATVKERAAWPPFFARTLILDATTGGVRHTEEFAALSAGTRARRWIRLLHSGEALGRVVQALSGLACLGGCVLVYTGGALAWRRFFPRRPAVSAG
ncbi:MAG: hypothetical protein RLZZ15_1186 [Verrucomicrobiota bacterium]|jgi:uncharacterized iron-regulated membrane protein